MNIELLNTGLKASTSYTDEVWQNGCCWALMYRLGFNNATRVANMVDEATYGRLPVGNKGIMLVGASENPYEEPGFEAYVARLRRSVICHFLDTRYGIDIGPADIEPTCANRPDIWNDVNELADRFMNDEVLSEFVPTWGRSVRNDRKKHGNLFETLVVPTYERRTGKRYVPLEWEDPLHPGMPRPKQAAPTPTAPQTSAVPKFCSNCGSPLSPGAKFCSNCGNRIA